MFINKVAEAVNAKADFTGQIGVSYRYTDALVASYKNAPVPLTESEKNEIYFDFQDENGDDVASVTITVDDRQTGEGARVVSADVEDQDDEEVLPYYRNLCFWAMMKVTDPDALASMPADFLA